MNFFQGIESRLAAWANAVPLEAFTLVGGFVEEVVAPIPSPLVLATAGSIAFAQNKTYWFLVWLSAIGSVGKLFGAWLVYFISDKLEDVVVGKFGRFFGVTHEEIESIGKQFSGGWRDASLLFILRALPIMPSSPVSVISGVLKINLKVYLLSTLLGNFVRNLIFICLGYAGLEAYRSLLGGFDRFESYVQVLIFIALAGLVGWIYWRRGRGKPLDWLKRGKEPPKS